MLMLKVMENWEIGRDTWWGKSHVKSRGIFSFSTFFFFGVWTKSLFPHLNIGVNHYFL
jgi:hypothetical protein